MLSAKGDGMLSFDSLIAVAVGGGVSHCISWWKGVQRIFSVTAQITTVRFTTDQKNEEIAFARGESEHFPMAIWSDPGPLVGKFLD